MKVSAARQIDTASPWRLNVHSSKVLLPGVAIKKPTPCRPLAGRLAPTASHIRSFQREKSECSGRKNSGFHLPTFSDIGPRPASKVEHPMAGFQINLEASQQERPSISQEYVSTGCSRTVGSLSWGQEGLLAFGSHNLVAIYNLQVRPSAISKLCAGLSTPTQDGQCTCMQHGIVGTMKGHTEKVSCTSWLPSAGGKSAAMCMHSDAAQSIP